MEALIQGKTLEEIPVKKPPEIDQHSTVIKDLDKLENRFCTEFLLSGGDMDKEEIEAMTKRYADSIIIVGSSSMLRVHAHTNEPEKLLSELRKHGAPKQQKVDDMLKQNEMLAGKHPDIALVVDSACDLPRKIMDRYGIHTVPLSIEFGDEVYLDKQTIRPKQFVQMLEGKDKYPTSSGPAIGQFKELYDKLKDNHDSIISLHLSDELSGTYSTAKTAAKVIEGTKISVLNTRQVSTSFGLVAYEVARSIRQGSNHEEVLEVAAKASDKANILVSVKDLQHMIREGRVSYTKGLFARLFNVKPVVSLDREGASTLSGRPISFRGALKKMVSKIEQVEKNEGISTYCIGHTRNESNAAKIEEKLKAITGKPPEYVMDISPMISSHAGKGAVSISYIGKSPVK